MNNIIKELQKKGVDSYLLNEFLNHFLKFYNLQDEGGLYDWFNSLFNQITTIQKKLRPDIISSQTNKTSSGFMNPNQPSSGFMAPPSQAPTKSQPWGNNAVSGFQSTGGGGDLSAQNQNQLNAIINAVPGNLVDQIRSIQKTRLPSWMDFTGIPSSSGYRR